MQDTVRLLAGGCRIRLQGIGIAYQEIYGEDLCEFFMQKVAAPAADDGAGWCNRMAAEWLLGCLVELSADEVGNRVILYSEVVF